MSRSDETGDASALVAATARLRQMGRVLLCEVVRRRPGITALAAWELAERWYPSETAYLRSLSRGAAGDAVNSMWDASDEVLEREGLHVHDTAVLGDEGFLRYVVSDMESYERDADRRVFMTNDASCIYCRRVEGLRREDWWRHG